jgi:MFS family permease
MWERFSYYGMRALLVLYLVNGLHWSDRDAGNLYGTYTALAYGVQIGGGFLADRFLGTRLALVLGGATIAAGHFVLAFPGTATLYAGLALIVAGTGLFKPNVSTMVGQLYERDDARRDSGFTIFYMGINLGAMVAPLVTGYLADRVGWQWGFAAAGVGMVIGLALYLWESRQRKARRTQWRAAAPVRLCGSLLDGVRSGWQLRQLVHGSPRRSPSRRILCAHELVSIRSADGRSRPRASLRCIVVGARASQPRAVDTGEDGMGAVVAGAELCGTRDRRSDG